ncbi:MAG: acyl carrier protein [Burkholderiales bacterium]
MPSPDQRLPAMVAFAVEHLYLDLEPEKAARESLPALGIDSLEFMALASALEEAFDIELDLSRLGNSRADGEALSLAETLDLLIVERE